MIRTWLTDQGFLLGPAFALVVFFVVFIGVLVWIYRPGSRQVYEHEAQLPFDTGSQGGRAHASTKIED
jgi:cbb3-type cytochrome oxidase subunit 3